jgi:limonene-1,2-epoxide hydrolase
MTANIEAVQGFVAAFNAIDLDRIMAAFAKDAVYHNMPMAPLEGVDAIRPVIQGFIGKASEIDWQVHQIAETPSGVVLTERTDRFLVSGKWIVLPVMGAFEVDGGLITVWRDYFDMQQYASQLAP